MTLYDVTESEGHAIVNIVVRSGILLNQVTVTISIMDDSASSEHDSLYVIKSGESSYM